MGSSEVILLWDILVRGVEMIMLLMLRIYCYGCVNVGDNIVGIENILL